MNALNPWTTGVALAVTFGVVYSVCAAAFAFWPVATLDFFNAWFHGLNLAGLQTGAKPFTVGVFIYGFVGIVVSGFVTGAVFAASYNLVGRFAGGSNT